MFSKQKTCVSPSQCVEIIRLVKAGHASGTSLLEEFFRRSIRFLVERRLPADLVDQCVAEVFDNARIGMRNGDVDEFESLPLFLRHIVVATATRVAERFGSQTTSMPGPQSSETQVQILAEQYTVAIEELPDTERDILYRYYVDRQSDDEIARDIGVSGDAVISAKRRLRQAFKMPAGLSDESVDRTFEPHGDTETRIGKRRVASP